MRRLAIVLGVALAASPCVANAQLDAQSLSDRELATLRGGFALPGGLNVSVGVTTDTRVDGQTVLRSVFTLDDRTPRMNMQAVREGQTALSTIDVVPDGTGVATANGVVSVRGLPGGNRITLDGVGTDVTHLAGQAFGSVLANTVDNRAIDVSTTVDIRVSGVTPDMLGSAMLRVEGLALDAASRLGR